MLKAINYIKENLFTNRTSGQTVVKNSFWLFWAQGITKGAMFLVAVLIARYYTVEEYGVFGYVFSVMTLISMVADFGLTNITIRELANNRSELQTYFDNALSLKILLTIVAFVVMVVATAFLKPGIRIIAILAGVALLLEGLTDYLRISFRIIEHSQFEVIIKTATAILLIGLVACCIVLNLPLAAILIGFIMTNLVGLLLSFRLLDRRISYSLNPSRLGHLFRESLPMFLGLLCTSAFSQIDLILIQIYRGFAEVGLYQAAYRLLFGFQLLRVVHMAMFPRLSSLYAEGNIAGYRKLIRTSLLMSLFTLIPVGLITTFFPAEIIGLIFGQEYVSASIALPLLIWSGIVAFIGGFYTFTFVIAKIQRSWLAIELSALVLLIVIEVILIPRMGFIGAAIATFAGELFFLLLAAVSVYVNRKLRVFFY
jgi:O-antigen/teichoic acid export membrane protein